MDVVSGDANLKRQAALRCSLPAAFQFSPYSFLAC
jgi:hypothetical protein